MLRGNVVYKGKEDKIKGVVLKSKFFKESNQKQVSNKILVCIKTDLINLHVLSRFRGIVTSYGGVLSHAAIYSREFKIPCIAGVVNILKETKSGDEVEMNMETGEIKILAHKK